MTYVTLAYDHHLTPFVRVGRERDTTRVNRYHNSRDAFAWAIREAACKAGVTDDDRDAAAWSLMLSFYRKRRDGDLDNLVKSVMDAGQGILWGDDVRVVAVDARIYHGQTDDALTMAAETIGPWPGQVDVIETADDALRIIGRIG